MSRGALQDSGRNNLDSHLIERQNLIRRTALSHETGHAPNHAAGLILHVDARSQGAQRFASLQPVWPHAGEHHRKRSGSLDTGDRVKEDIDRRAAKILLRALMSLEDNAPIFLAGHHMKVSRSDHRATGGESFLDRVNSRTDRRSGSRVLLSLRKIGI
jgi:hypothetical protein